MITATEHPDGWYWHCGGCGLTGYRGLRTRQIALRAGAQHRAWQHPEVRPLPMAQIRDQQQRLREARRLGLCTTAEPVATCLDRLAAHDRLAALGPDLLAFVQRHLAWSDGDSTVLLADLDTAARVLLARAEGETA